MLLVRPSKPFEKRTTYWFCVEYDKSWAEVQILNNLKGIEELAT